MYKYVALGIIAIAGIMAIPVSVDSQDDSKMYGYATLVLRDAAGQAVFQQIIHNDLLNRGENYMLAQSFNNGTGGFISTEADLVDSICVTSEGSFSVDETETAAQFNSNDNQSGFSCESVLFTITAEGNTATTGAIQFNSSGTNPNIVSGQIITGIGICSDNGQTNEGRNDASNEGCGTSAGDAPLIAEVNTSDVTLTDPETVEITYTLTLE